MKGRKPMIKNYSKPKKSYTRVPSGEKRILLDTKSSMFAQDYNMNIPQNQWLINDKVRPKLIISPTNAQSSKGSNLTSAESRLLNYTQLPIYFNTKKAKSRKRNLNSKNTYSDK